MYILWSSDVHQKWVKMAGNWAKMVRLDKMSRRNEGWTGKKFTFGQNVQMWRENIVKRHYFPIRFIACGYCFCFLGYFTSRC